MSDSISPEKAELYEEIIFYLAGSCESLSVALEAHDAEYLEDDMEFLGILDAHIFLCADCGWWYPLSELSEEDIEQVCNGCNEQYEE